MKFHWTVCVRRDWMTCWQRGAVFRRKRGDDSVRVIGTALATGWAAGTIAAFQASGRPLNVAVEFIRQQNENQ